MPQIDIKPISTNRLFQGRRFRTQEYDRYEKEVMWKLPAYKMPEPPFHLIIKVGLSNKLADLDNIIKPFGDILQKRYNFNDRDIHKITAEKVKTKKGEEFISFLIESKK